MMKKVEEQAKTIEYIKELYRQKTGDEVTLPMSWQDFLCMERGDVPSQQLPNIHAQ